MATNICDCGQGGQNTGHNCTTKPKVGTKQYIVPIYGSDGTKNRIASTDVLDQSYFEALLNATNPADRWFDLGIIENLTDAREDPIQKTYNSGRVQHVSEGQKNVAYEVPAGGSVWLGKAQSFMCGQYGIVEVDAEGTAKGQVETESGVKYFYPAKIEGGTFYPRLVPAVDEALEYVSIQYSYDKSLNDANFGVIKKSEMDGFDLLDTNGLLDINVVISAITTTTFTAALTLDYGTAFTGLPVTGFVTADFELNEITPTPGAIVITSAVETGIDTGVYDFTIPAATSADLLSLSKAVAKLGFANFAADVLIP